MPWNVYSVFLCSQSVVIGVVQNMTLVLMEKKLVRRAPLQSDETVRWKQEDIMLQDVNRQRMPVKLMKKWYSCSKYV